MAEKKQRSYIDRRHREWSWLLYINEGLAANMAHAQAVNCVTFDERDQAMLAKLQARVESNIRELRSIISKG